MTTLVLTSPAEVAAAVGSVVTVTVTVSDDTVPVFRSSDGYKLSAKKNAQTGAWSAQWVTLKAGTYAITVNAGDADPVSASVVVGGGGGGGPEPDPDITLSDEAVAVLLNLTGSATQGAARALIAGDIEDSETAIGGALSATIEEVGGAAFVSITKRPVHAADYGVSAANSDNTAGLEDAAVEAVGVALHLPAGDLTVAGASRLPPITDASSGLIGDDGEGTVLRFTHPTGGIDVGNGTDYVYKTRLRNLVITGNGICEVPLRIRKGEELKLEHVRIGDAAVAAADISDTSQIQLFDFQLAPGPGVRFFGVIGRVTVRDANLYQSVAPFKVSATAFGPFFYEDGWSEQCEDLIVFDTGSAVVCGPVIIKDSHFIHPGSVARVFRVAGGLVNSGSGLLSIEGSSFFWPSVGTPMVDFSAVNQAGVVNKIQLRDLIVSAPSLGSEHLIRPHAAQAWNDFYVNVHDIDGLDVDRWHIGNNTPGGVRYRTQDVDDYTDDPNGVIKGFIGWKFTSQSNGSVWRKTSGQGTNAGWVTP